MKSLKKSHLRISVGLKTSKEKSRFVFHLDKIHFLETCAFIQINAIAQQNSTLAFISAIYSAIPSANLRRGYTNRVRILVFHASNARFQIPVPQYSPPALPRNQFRPRQLPRETRPTLASPEVLPSPCANSIGRFVGFFKHW